MLDYASVIKNHPRYTTKIRPNTEATLGSKVPEIGKVEVKKPAKLIEEKKAASRKRRVRNLHLAVIQCLLNFLNPFLLLTFPEIENASSLLIIHIFPAPHFISVLLTAVKN